jgi:hypothetical protein
MLPRWFKGSKRAGFTRVRAAGGGRGRSGLGVGVVAWDESGEAPPTLGPRPRRAHLGSVSGGRPSRVARPKTRRALRSARGARRRRGSARRRAKEGLLLERGARRSLVERRAVEEERAGGRVGRDDGPEHEPLDDGVGRAAGEERVVDDACAPPAVGRAAAAPARLRAGDRPGARRAARARDARAPPGAAPIA